MQHVAALLAVLLISGAAAAQDAPLPPIDKAGIPADMPVATALPAMTRIILVGDSTMQVGSGWGGSFCAFHVTSQVACLDLAKGGRSSGSYRADRFWDIALAEMRSGGYAATYVLIQFGHNDQPGKPGRSTDLATQYPANLEHYVDDARAAGAIPILVTPLTRRQFMGGQLQRDLDPWSDAVRKVAAAANAPLLDLGADSETAVQTMGAQAATRLSQVPPSPEVLAAARTGTTVDAKTGVTPPVPHVFTDEEINATAEPLGDPKRAFDYTHLGRDGADFFAVMVTSELARAVPALRRVLLP
ncbi:MAG TPA: rhamnogalacturonan acetylesterase [Rhizomicrobium sp.]|jgi:lysophospholipase L1-like esterase|nr:rhamnogalacturonan acetylesterase [Rhizomicrobium sp.]